MRLVRLAGVVVLIAPFLAQAAPPAAEPEEDAASQVIITKYLDAAKTQQRSMRGAQMEVRIAAKLPRLEKQGTLKALRTISKFGKITYKALGFSGDSFIKNEVITRYLSAESEVHDPGALAITPANYKFKYKGAMNQNGRRVQILQVTPRKKMVGLFRGEIWMDAETAMPVREAGRFVKNPSIGLKKVEFVREYEIQDGVAIPTHIESTADVRVVGRAELSIDFSNFTRQESAEDAAPDSNR
ncbi:MAG TPA: hypothetical protein VK419_18005 [Bryobacteraceae bacterium]|nr:hypothetical protein [Bryobacteraceae bacterium]